MKIGIASDHGGYELKQKICKYLCHKKLDIIDYGTDSVSPVDYPKYAYIVGSAIQSKEIDLGILICKTGIGMSIAANKMPQIRCAKVDNTKEAKYSKLHNNANIIALSSKLPMIRVKDILDTFIKTEFSNEKRHIKRNDEVDKMANL